MIFWVVDKKTGKEADPYEIALNEDWAKSLCYCDMEGFAIQEDGTLILADECGRHSYPPEGRFEIIWDDTDNSPLSWAELCKMEDTPVWLEWSSDGQWVLIAYKVDDDLKFFRYGDDRIFTITREDYKSDKWQAYRKARE